jgi:glycine/betaine/sarcosine/D-proline reductase family selenoprotein B
VITALFSLALTTGAPRVIKGARIEHVCGDPTLGPERDVAFRREIVRTALESLTTQVTEPTLFEPAGA